MQNAALCHLKKTSKEKKHAFVAPHTQSLSFSLPLHPYPVTNTQTKYTKIEQNTLYEAIFFLIDPEICLKIFGLLCGDCCCSAPPTTLPLLTSSLALTPPSCRASNLSGAIEKSIFACSLASAVMGLCFRPSVLDPSLME
jgi:hypothetical protein